MHTASNPHILQDILCKIIVRNLSQDVSDGHLDRWNVEDETSNNNNEQFFDTYDGSPRGGTHEHRRGKADGQSTENVQGGPGGVDLNGNLGGPGPRELRQVARDASDARHYYHTQIAPVSKGKDYEIFFFKILFRNQILIKRSAYR